MADWFATSVDNDQEQVHDDLPFRSRRSPVICRNGCVASSQPLASSVGLDMLRKGANAAEAAIAVAATLCVTEPCSTGLGGDMFCLVYDSQTKKVSCVNGSGISPSKLTLETVVTHLTDQDGKLNAQGLSSSPHAVTVPGAAGGYEGLLEKHGSGTFSLADLLEPAAVLAEEGFPVAPITAHHWQSGMPSIKRWLSEEEPVPLTVDGQRPPDPGDIIQNPDMARVLRELGAKGATEGFYAGRTGEAIVAAVQKHGGLLSMEDLKSYHCDFPEPIAAEYRGVKLWEVPPNGQGVAALIALAGIQYLEEHSLYPKLTSKDIGKAAAYHVMIEMMRLGFADGRAHVACPQHTRVDNQWLVDPVRIGKRAAEVFDPTRAAVQGLPLPSSCTVSFQVVDKEGNAVSFVNSNFTGFGSGIVPEGCGFSLQNRGFGFTLEKDHPNVLGPSKRPYHTIIPGMTTYADTNELHSTLSNMGGNMQPQGHLQLAVSLIAGELDPQTAVDLPRFCIADGTQNGRVLFEGGVDEEDEKALREMGHNMKTGVVGFGRSVFGRAQIIKRDRKTGVLWAGSDGRADGCAMGY